MEWIDSGACFNEDRRYRYYLWRIWDARPKALCIGLNPSTADETSPDPTIRNLCKLLNSMGYGGLYMMNLFSFVSSQPEVLTMVPYPVSEKEDKERNDRELIRVSSLCKGCILLLGLFQASTMAR